MENRPIVAIMYDFDKTLSTKNMQEYAFIPGIEMSADDFWAECEKLIKEHHMDPILAYMFLMKQEAEGKMLITRDIFKGLGRSVELFDGVDTWFTRINDYARNQDVDVEHYIISSGLKEIIEGTEIAGYFTKIYAAEFLYNEKNVPAWPAMALNYTSKTQFLFRINKGALDETDHSIINEYTPEDKRRIPFRNMIFIGDGLTDVPCMKLCKANGGHSIAVYQGDKAAAAKMLIQERVDFIAPADYSKNSKIEKIVFTLINEIKAVHETINMHINDLMG